MPPTVKLFLTPPPPPQCARVPTVWPRHRAVQQGQSRGSIGLPRDRKGVPKGNDRRSRALGGERLRGTAAYGGKGFKERSSGSGGRPIGRARFRQQSTAGL